MTNPLEAVSSDVVAVPEKPGADSVIGQLKSLVDQGLQGIKPYAIEQIRTLVPGEPYDLPGPIPEYADAEIQSGSVIVFPMESRFLPLRTIFSGSIDAIKARCINEGHDLLFIRESGRGGDGTIYSTSSRERANQLKSKGYTYTVDSNTSVPMYVFVNITVSDLNEMPIRAFTRSQVLAEKKLSHQLSPDQLLSSGVNEEQYAKDRDALKSVLALFGSVLPKTFARIAEILSICLDSQFRYVDDPDCIRETGNRGSGSIPNDSTHRNDLNSIEGRELHLHPLIRKLAEDDDLEDGNTAATDAYDKKNFDHSAKYDASMEKLTQKIANGVYDTDKHLSHFFILDGRLQGEIIEYVLKGTHFGERFSGLIGLIYAHNLMGKQIDPRISSEFLRCIATLNSRISESNIKSFIISRFYILPLVIQNSQVGKLIKDQFPLVLNQGESV